MAVIKSGASTDQLTIDPTSKAARVTLYKQDGAEVFPDVLGSYVVTGFTAAVVAAALATDTMLMSFRVQVASTRKIVITRVRVGINVATVGASGGVAGVLGIQRFTAQTPTGGTTRTYAKKAATDSASDVTDIRDSNAALTGTAPTFGDVLYGVHVPVTTVGYAFESVFDPSDEGGAPGITLVAGDGIALRTRVQMAATQTWQYSYTIHWLELA